MANEALRNTLPLLSNFDITTVDSTEQRWETFIPENISHGNPYIEQSRGRVICDFALQSLGGKVLDTSALYTPQHFRLLHCSRFTNDKRVCVHEFTDLSTIAYSVISYTWRGRPMDPDEAARDQDRIFHVYGAEDGDPISLDVLHHVCLAAIREGLSYIWLDRLCIMQESRDDKTWQIARMHSIYRDCHVCLILPGGLRRMIGLEEETDYIHRGWTLQECIAPCRSLVLYKWHMIRSSRGRESTGSFFDPRIVVSGQSATSPLLELLQSAINPPTIRVMGDCGETKFKPIIDIFGSGGALLTLVVAIASKEDAKMKRQAIWRSALMRTSSRPVDMVFSIMGLFGVTLDTRIFRKDDRLGATVALGRELARKGDTIDWLGAGLLLPPCRQLSSFPAFPITTVSGKATLSTIHGIREVSTFYNSFEGTQWLCDLPLMVSMDDGGYTTIRAQTLRILSLMAGPDANQPHLRTLSTDRGTYSCKIHDYDEMSLSETNRHDDFIPAENSRVLMVNLGELKQPIMASFPRFLEPWAGRAILVKEHAPERFHRIAWCEYNTYNARNGLFEEACSMDDVSIGGPNPLCDVH